jgi:predicted dehydrogenase
MLEESRPLGIGLIGAGMVGQRAHLANFVNIPSCRVVALAELRPDLGRDAALKYGVERIYPSHRELLADREVKAVVVVTRRPALGPIVLSALEAGKHVLSEKPMAHSIAQAERLLQAAQSSGTVFSVGYMKRHDAGVQEGKRWFERLRGSGELGAFLGARFFSFGGRFADGSDDYVMTPEQRPEGLELWPIAPDWLPGALHDDYAWFLNVFCHSLNLLRFFFDATPELRWVDFAARNGRVAVFRIKEAPVVLEMAEIEDPGWREGVEIRFERGCLAIDLPAPLSGLPARVRLERADVPHRDDPEIVPSWAFRRQAEAFVRDVREGRTPLASGADAIEDLRLAEAMWQRHVKAL